MVWNLFHVRPNGRGQVDTNPFIRYLKEENGSYELHIDEAFVVSSRQVRRDEAPGRLLGGAGGQHRHSSTISYFFVSVSFWRGDAVAVPLHHHHQLIHFAPSAWSRLGPGLVPAPGTTGLQSTRRRSRILGCTRQLYFLGGGDAVPHDHHLV